MWLVNYILLLELCILAMRMMHLILEFLILPLSCMMSENFPPIFYVHAPVMRLCEEMVNVATANSTLHHFSKSKNIIPFLDVL
jgi:hypothetical protein